VNIDVAADVGAEYVNEHGGIDGVPIKVTSIDFGGEIERGLSAYERAKMMEPRPLIFVHWYSALGEALHDLYVEDGFTCFTSTAPATIYPLGNSFGTMPLYAESFCGFCDWLAEKWQKEGNELPVRLGVITWDTAFGRGFITKESYAYAEEHGIEIVAEEFYKLTDVDVTTHLIRLRETGVDWLYNLTVSIGPVPVLKGLVELGWDVPLGTATGCDWSVVRQVPLEYSEGIYMYMFITSWDEEDHPGIQYMKKKFAEKDPDYWDKITFVQVNTVSEQMYYAYIIGEAVKEVGWENLSAEAIKKQIVSTKDWWDPLKLVPYSFSPERYTPKMMRMTQVRNGKFIPITDWFPTHQIVPAELL